MNKIPLLLATLMAAPVLAAPSAETVYNEAPTPAQYSRGDVVLSDTHHYEAIGELARLNRLTVDIAADYARRQGGIIAANETDQVLLDTVATQHSGMTVAVIRNRTAALMTQLMSEGKQQYLDTNRPGLLGSPYRL